MPSPCPENDDFCRPESDQFRVLLGSSSLSFLHFLVVTHSPCAPGASALCPVNMRAHLLLRQIHVVLSFGYGLGDHLWFVSVGRRGCRLRGGARRRRLSGACRLAPVFSEGGKARCERKAA